MSDYWIYIFSEKSSKEFFQNPKYICINYYYNLKPNDTIIFYIKDNGNISGFKGYCILKNKLEENNFNIKIFKDLNMNKYIASIFKIKIFEHIIPVKDFFNSIKDNLSGYRTIQSFYLKFIKEFNCIINLNYNDKGKEIVDKLNELINDANYKPVILKPKNKDNYYNQHNVSITVSEDKTHNIELNNSPTMIDNNDSDTSNNSDNESNDESDADDNEHNIIPILVILCSNINKNNINEIVKHIIKCKSCEINNNNKDSINNLLDLKLSKILEIKKNNDVEIESIIEHYYNDKRYKFDENIIKFLLIDFNHDIYNNCLFIILKN